ncbi:hypothetical protein [Piscinibacter sakaiensis]|uniref:hypothetical protein n=1 Tax=Piscinibacter sakaiensis TaxID=1547922 RepID=UPI003AAC47AD
MAHGWIWLIFGAAMVASYLRFGWQGAVLVFSAGVFVVLLQFSRAMRAMQAAARAPVGSVGSAVMLNARLRPGMRLPQILHLTGSLGQRQPAGDDPAVDIFRWSDDSGSSVEVELRHGRCQRWTLDRPQAEPERVVQEPSAGANEADTGRPG